MDFHNGSHHPNLRLVLTQMHTDRDQDFDIILPLIQKFIIMPHSLAYIYIYAPNKQNHHQM